MTHYMADSISRLESGASDETAFDDAVPVFAVRANTFRGLDAAKYVGGRTVRGIDRDAVLSAKSDDGYCKEIVKALNAERRIPFFEDPDMVLRATRGARRRPPGGGPGLFSGAGPSPGARRDSRWAPRGVPHVCGDAAVLLLGGHGGRRRLLR